MTSDVLQEIITNYQRHGWELKRVLLKPSTLLELKDQTAELVNGEALVEAELDALWFARPSHAGREAWELRLIAEHQYALFEAFEADEIEEEREDRRKELEAIMREQVAARS
jgi:hypothetical protein